MVIYNLIWIYLITNTKNGNKNVRHNYGEVNLDSLRSQITNTKNGNNVVTLIYFIILEW